MTPKNTATMTTAEVVVRSLAAQGIRELFCVPGIQNDEFFDALVRVGHDIRPIHTRHEQATAYMALGAAQATGRPHAYCVVPGPGFLNTTAALSTAFATNAPVLAVVGQIAERFIGKGAGLLHEIPDQMAIMRGLTKWSERVNGPEDAAEKVRTAFAQMRSGLARPVGLECPMSVWRKEGSIGIDETVVPRSTPKLDDAAFDRAAEILAKAKRPLIVVGSGALGASAEVLRLAELIEAPVIAFRAGQGVIDSRHRLSLPLLGGYLLWKDADVVIGIGTRLQPAMDWGLDDAIKTIHLEIDDARIGRTHTPTVALAADASEGARALIARVEKSAVASAKREAEIAAVRAEIGRRTAKLAPQKAWIDALRRALPEDGILVNELTQIGYAAHLLWPTYGPRRFLSPGYQGTLGWGYAAALGAKVARPDLPVVSISGDGGFMFGVQELATAVHHKIGVVAVVFNDGGFGNVKRIQQQVYGGRTVAVDFSNPDFVKLGESFGVHSVRAATPDALARAVTEAIRADVPALIEIPFRLADFPSPWDLLINMKKLRGPEAGRSVPHV